MIRIFIADEHPVVLMGLRTYFRGTEFQVVGEAANGSELVEGIEQLRPNMVLLDSTQRSFRAFMKERNSGQAKPRRLTYKIIENTAALKSVSKELFFETIRRAAPKFGKKLAPQPKKLTPREVEVLQLIVQGQSNKEIARTLHIALETVKEHVQNILRKTEHTDRTQAAIWAVKQEIASV